MTGTAPAWVSYAGLGVAIFAALVALTSAGIAFASYRAAGPRTRLEIAYRLKDRANPRALVDFTFVNRGRADISVVGFYISQYGSRKPLLEIAADDVTGPDRPHRVSSSAQETWSVNVLPIAKRYSAALADKSVKVKSSWPAMFYFGVKCGNGKYVRAKWNRFDAHQMIADLYGSE